MSLLIILPVIFLKFFLPILFIWFPFMASWLNFFLDLIDGDILMHFGLARYDYQTIDKAADYVTYIMMFWVGRKWKIGKLITFLFILRTIGQVLFFVTRNDFYFFLFPNLLEPLFMIYSLLLFLDKKKAHKRYLAYLVPIWIFILSYKMWNEWNTHIAHIDLSQLFFGFNN